MPTGYAGEGKRFEKKTGRWVKKETTKAVEYDKISKEQQKAWALLISFYRYYPDYWYDLIRSKNARYKLELPNRIMLRAFARYRNVYITGARGLTKTTTVVESKTHDGTFYPGEKIRYCAPSQKQSARLASQAFADLARDYPIAASYWNVNNDRDAMFRITTNYGSEFTMYAPRGDNSSAIVGEEMAQEGEDGFDMETFEADISPTCRLDRKIHGINDRTHINLKEAYISNAASRQNKAFYKYRAAALDEMKNGDKYDGICLDISWVSALLCNLRTIEYYKKERRKLSPENWLREMCVRYVGAGESPLIPDEQVLSSRTARLAEFEHCGDPEAIYIIAHDVSYADGRKNAQCADIVLKLTRFDDEKKADSYRKQVVFADAYSPLPDFEQARKIKRLWSRYCMDGGEGTYLLVDAQAYGTGVVEELIKPTADGLPNLRTMNNDPLFARLEQKGALPVLYAMKATPRGGKDPDGDMIQYAQHEFEHGNVELLTSNLYDGLETFKNYHDIKDDIKDAAIVKPYRFTEQLCQQITNLKAEVSGFTFKERRKSMQIQRDIWSALKYALRLAQYLENSLKKEHYTPKSEWAAIAQSYENGTIPSTPQTARQGATDIRTKLLAGNRRLR